MSDAADGFRAWAVADGPASSVWEITRADAREALTGAENASMRDCCWIGEHERCPVHGHRFDTFEPPR